MSGHTPGPWHVGPMQQVWSANLRVADCQLSTSLISHKERLSNARLIAAAPEMLDALEWLGNRVTMDEDEQDMIQHALAKAKRS